MCHDRSWPGFCSLMVSICEAVNAGVCVRVLHYTTVITFWAAVMQTVC